MCQKYILIFLILSEKNFRYSNCVWKEKLPDILIERVTGKRDYFTKRKITRNEGESLNIIH